MWLVGWRLPSVADKKLLLYVEIAEYSLKQLETHMVQKLVFLSRALRTVREACLHGCLLLSARVFCLVFSLCGQPGSDRGACLPRLFAWGVVQTNLELLISKQATLADLAAIIREKMTPILLKEEQELAAKRAKEEAERVAVQLEQARRAAAASPAGSPTAGSPSPTALPAGARSPAKPKDKDKEESKGPRPMEEEDDSKGDKGDSKLPHAGSKRKAGSDDPSQQPGAGAADDNQRPLKRPKLGPSGLVLSSVRVRPLTFALVVPAGNGDADKETKSEEDRDAERDRERDDREGQGQRGQGQGEHGEGGEEGDGEEGGEEGDGEGQRRRQPAPLHWSTEEVGGRTWHPLRFLMIDPSSSKPTALRLGRLDMLVVNFLRESGRSQWASERDVMRVEVSQSSASVTIQSRSCLDSVPCSACWSLAAFGPRCRRSRSRRITSTAAWWWPSAWATSPTAGSPTRTCSAPTSARFVLCVLACFDRLLASAVADRVAFPLI